jgi:hypothetical protein
MFPLFEVPVREQHNALTATTRACGVVEKVTVETSGVDHLWVMQMTFVLTIAVGAPVVAVAALFTPLPTWTDRALFAIRVGAGVWFLTAIAVYIHARRRAGDV